MSERGAVFIRGADPVVARRVARVAAALGCEVLEAGSASAHEPVGLVVELERDDALATIRDWREAHPDVTIVGYLTTPGAERWHEAEAAGADAVTTRGLVDRELARLVEDRLSGARVGRRLRVAPERDFAGRLGYVGSIADTPAGPIALYHVGSRIHAVSDICPHAGASLCAGELEGDVITCPRHGSQFRVSDGERVRGPADKGIEHFAVVVEAGEVFVELPA